MYGRDLQVTSSSDLYSGEVPNTTPDPAVLAQSLRATGMRVTAIRERVYAALTEAPHSTPEEIIERVNAAGAAAVPPSSVYRALEALEEIGLVTHTHLDHRAPTYHRADHDRHLHLVCRSCGVVLESPAGVAEPLVRELEREHGFVADVTHMAIQGECRRCRS